MRKVLFIVYLFLSPTIPNHCLSSIISFLPSLTIQFTFPYQVNVNWFSFFFFKKKSIYFIITLKKVTAVHSYWCSKTNNICHIFPCSQYWNMNSHSIPRGYAISHEDITLTQCRRFCTAWMTRLSNNGSTGLCTALLYYLSVK